MSTPLLRPHVRPSAVRSAVVGALLLTLAVSPGLLSAATPIPTFVPIGAGYEADTLQQFATEAVKADSSGDVSIVVLPIAYGVDPLSMSNGLRKTNLTLADNRRGQIEAACLVVIPVGKTCHVVLAPVLIRADAFAEANIDLVNDIVDLDGIFVLGGDQDVAMLVVANSPFEEALARAQAAGAVTSGNSAGAAVESADMIAGYFGSNGPEQGFEANTVDVWSYDPPSDDMRGLIFGLQDVLLDQHVFQRGRIARLISASFTAGELGIGVDANTAATIEGGTNLTKIGGDTGAFVADSLTYPATGVFDQSGTGTLSIHDVATHVLAPGDGYDMAVRQPIVGGVAAPAPSLATRAFPTLTTPAGSGPLLLAGGTPASSVLDRLVANSGGAGSKIVVIAAGYAKSELATKDAKAFAASLASGGANSTWFVLDSKTKTADVTAALAAADGVLLTAPDPSTVLASLNGSPVVTAAIHDAWLDGAALLANDAAASAISAGFTTDARPGDSTGEIEAAGVAEFLSDSAVAGLGWVGVAVEPGIVSNHHWGRLYSVVKAQANHLAFGIDAGTAVEFRASLTAPSVVGDSVGVALDGQYGTFGTGSNGVLAAHWVILDTFVSGESITP